MISLTGHFWPYRVAPVSRSVPLGVFTYYYVECCAKYFDRGLGQMKDRHHDLKKYSCASTGYRPHRSPWKDNEADPRCVALKTAMTEQIASLAQAGVTDYYSGSADGTDCWALLIVLSLREKIPH